MPKKDINYISIIDSLRTERNMTAEDLCENIVNPRTYRRYLSGERKMSHEKIGEFCEKLEITSSDLHFLISQRERDEYVSIIVLYNLLGSQKYDEFYQRLKKIDRDKIFTKQNKKLLELCVQRARFLTGKSNDYMIKRKATELIDYPNCLNRTMFDFVDIMGLKLIAELEIKDKKEEGALNKLIHILENSKTVYINSETRHILPSLYASVAILLGRLDKYKKSFSVAEEGIKLSLHYNDHSSLAHLYYMKGVSLKRVGTFDESKKYLGKAIIVAIIKDSKEEIKMFKKAVKDHFGIETDDAIINTLKSALQ